MNDQGPASTVVVRRHGGSGPTVIVVHGGPGAQGSARGLAAMIAEDGFRVLEPFQRRSGGVPLSVARHVADLQEVVATRCDGGRSFVVGHSWGAMLALAWAAAHPDAAVALVLVGCGTFDPAARDEMQRRRAARTDEALEARVAALAGTCPDPDERLRALAHLLMPVDSYDLVACDPLDEPCDARGHDESWRDMLRLQDDGTYPAAFGAIDVPVLMLHGVVDPHPGEMIRAGLVPYLPQLEHVAFERCGHYPWLERFARDEFFAVLARWLERRG